MNNIQESRCTSFANGRCSVNTNNERFCEWDQLVKYGQSFCTLYHLSKRGCVKWRRVRISNTYWVSILLLSFRCQPDYVGERCEIRAPCARRPCGENNVRNERNPYQNPSFSGRKLYSHSDRVECARRAELSMHLWCGRWTDGYGRREGDYRWLTWLRQ